MNKIFLPGAVAALSSLFVFSMPAFGESETSGRLLEHARQEISKGHYTSALDDYARALMLDSSDPKAAEGLMKAAAFSRLSAAQKIHLYQIQGLLQAHVSLSGRVAYYSGKIKDLKQRLDQLGVPAGAQESALAGHRHARPVPAGEAFVDLPPVAAEPQSLALLAKILREQLAVLQAQHESLSEEFHLLYNLQASAGFRFNAGDVRWPLVVAAGTSAPGLDIIDTRPGRGAGGPEIPGLNAEGFENEERMQGLSREIVRLTLEVTERDAEAKGRYTEISRLEKQVEELASRLNFGKNIIESKNEKIIGLENELAALKEKVTGRYEDLSAELSAKQQKISELSGIMEIYKLKLKDAQQEKLASSRNYEDVKNELAVLKNNLVYKDKELIEAHGILRNLEKDIGLIRQYIRSARAESFGDDQISLRDVSRIEEKLSETRRFLYEYSSELQELHEIISRP